MKQKATMADVARLAGVSPATAARVIHNNGYVSDENKERVLAAVQETGYRPNIQARSLRNSRSYTVGVVLSSAVQNPFFTNISHALRIAANRSGLSLLNFNHNYDARMERDGLQRFIEHNVEAVILCHALAPEHLKPVHAVGIPVVEIERTRVSEAARVKIDPRPGMQAALKDLVAKGHRRIAFLAGMAGITNRPGSTPLDSDHDRRNAFLEVAQACGLDAASLIVSEGPYDTPSVEDPLEGLTRGRALLTAAERPTAVIAGSDLLAAGLLQAALELGLRVPEDLSVIGYDDSIARFLAPALSSIRQPFEAIGEAAIELALSPITAGQGPQSRSLATTYVPRQSVGPVPG
ncbi:LacI family DNA-binding transcriptional regulator [Arenibacterium sp. LLYu02]|uniref:LacI family DNA-binding transcriptional regulator n=1 Tax=Arenibacterium sp. LLYu02 TaxID=3404132 RepID=UPI003B21AA3D